MRERQKTIKHEMIFAGIGVHSGVLSTVILKPVFQSDYGIKFWHKDRAGESLCVGAVIPEIAMHATVIKGNAWALSTIEHLMAALYILGVDTVDICVDGYEIPILDGSALPFIQGIQVVGLHELDASKRYITPIRTIKFEDDKGRFLEIEPDDNTFFVDYSAEFQRPLAGGSVLAGEVTQDFFCAQIAPARTFGFVEQLPFLRQHGLAQGTSLGNTMVMSAEERINTMRMSDECVRHKFLDLIGDLSLLGKMLLGRVRAHKTGHSFNRLVIQHYLEHPEEWREV